MGQKEGGGVGGAQRADGSCLKQHRHHLYRAITLHCCKQNRRSLSICSHEVRPLLEELLHLDYITGKSLADFMMEAGSLPSSPDEGIKEEKSTSFVRAPLASCPGFFGVSSLEFRGIFSLVNVRGRFGPEELGGLCSFLDSRPDLLITSHLPHVSCWNATRRKPFTPGDQDASKGELGKETRSWSEGQRP